MKKLMHLTPALLVIVVATVVFTYKFDRPLTYHHDWNGAHYGIFARNHLRYGLLTTKGAQITQVDNQPPGNFHYDFHHPFGYALILSAFQAFIPDPQTSVRLPSILASITVIYLLHHLSSRWWGKSVGFLTALLPIATPMLRYFASVPVQEQLVLAFILGQLVAYERWLDSSNEKTYWLIILFALLAGWVGWPGYYLTPLLIVHYWWVNKKINRSVLAWLLVPITLFLTHIGLDKFVTGEWFGGGLSKALQFRLTMTANEEAAAFTLKQFIIQAARWLTVFYTRVWIGLAMLGSILLITNWWRKKTDRRVSLILTTLLYGLTHPLIFRNAAYVHEYMWIYLIPFLSLSVGYLVFRSVQLIKLSHCIPITVASLLIFTIMWMERQTFVQTLFTNQLHLPGYQLGQLVSQYTQSGDQILVLNGEFISFFGKFARYYSDREIYTSESQLQKLPPKLIVIPKTHTLPAIDKIAQLDNQYVRHETDIFIWYDSDEIGK